MKQKLDDITYEEFLELQNKFKNSSKSKIPTYSFSSITENILESLVTIKKNYNIKILDNWLNNSIEISEKEIEFLQNLIDKVAIFLDDYKEETLKAHFVIPILNQVNFILKEYECSGLYEEAINYKSDTFIFNGTTDFMVSKGLSRCEKPYFFIQEFKRTDENSSVKSQLLAELICGIELNGWSQIKGAYIKGSIWNFVILEKLGKNRYQYFISRVFNSSNIEDLKAIYGNLLFVKNEIIEMVKNKSKESK